MAPLHTRQGMRAGKIVRVKRRLVREAVADNVATIQGLPPGPLRRGRRMGQLWLKRLSLVLIPLTLAGSTYFVSTTSTASSPLPPPLRLPPAAPRPPRPAFPLT